MDKLLGLVQGMLDLSSRWRSSSFIQQLASFPVSPFVDGGVEGGPSSVAEVGDFTMTWKSLTLNCP